MMTDAIKTIPKNRFILLMTLSFIVIKNDGYGQSLRLPINYFELLPKEAHWLIEGEGMLDFANNGLYKFKTHDLNKDILKCVEIRCVPDSIQITEIQNSDTNTILIFKPSEEDLVIKSFDIDSLWDNLSCHLQENQRVVSYDSKCILVYNNEDWTSCESPNGYSIFGDPPIKNSIYSGKINDAFSSLGHFKREVLLNAQHSYWISEKKNCFRLKFFNSYGYSICKTNRSLEIKERNYDLRMSNPPKSTILYESQLFVRFIGDAVFLYEKK